MPNKLGLSALVFALACSASPAFAEDGITDTTILIGQTVGVTGTVAGPVKETNEGAQAYFKAVNKAGGVFGRKIELRTLDDKFDPGEAFKNAKTLIEKDGVFAMFQGRGTPHVQGLVPLLEQHGVPLIAPSTGSTVFHQPVNRWVFNVRAKYHDEIAKAVAYLKSTGIQNIGLLHVDDAFGKDALAGYEKAINRNGLKTGTIVKFDRVKPNYDATAEEVNKSAPQALIIASSAKNTVEAIKAIRAKGGAMQLLTLSNNSSEAFVKDLGKTGSGVLVTQVTPSPAVLSTALGKEFKAAAQASGATLSYAAMEGFLNAKVLVEGLKRAGKTPTREGLVKALESMQNVDIGVPISYSAADHTGSEFVDLTMISRDGRFIH